MDDSELGDGRESPLEVPEIGRQVRAHVRSELHAAADSVVHLSGATDGEAPYLLSGTPSGEDAWPWRDLSHAVQPIVHEQLRQAFQPLIEADLLDSEGTREASPAGTLPPGPEGVAHYPGLADVVQPIVHEQLRQAFQPLIEADLLDSEGTREASPAGTLPPRPEGVAHYPGLADVVQPIVHEQLRQAFQPLIEADLSEGTREASPAGTLPPGPEGVAHYPLADVVQPIVHEQLRQAFQPLLEGHVGPLAQSVSRTESALRPRTEPVQSFKPIDREQRSARPPRLPEPLEPRLDSSQSPAGFNPLSRAVTTSGETHNRGSSHFEHGTSDARIRAGAGRETPGSQLAVPQRYLATTSPPRRSPPQPPGGRGGGGGRRGGGDGGGGGQSGSGDDAPDLPDLLDEVVGGEPESLLTESLPAVAELARYFEDSQAAESFTAAMAWDVVLQLAPRRLRAIVVSHGDQTKVSLLRFDPNLAPAEFVTEDIGEIVGRNVDAVGLVERAGIISTYASTLQTSGIAVTQDSLARAAEEVIASGRMKAVRTSPPRRIPTAGLDKGRGLSILTKGQADIVIGTIGVVTRREPRIVGVTADHVVDAMQSASGVTFSPNCEIEGRDHITDSALVSFAKVTGQIAQFIRISTIIGPDTIPAVGAGLNIPVSFYGGRSGYVETKIIGADPSSSRPRPGKLTEIYTKNVLSPGDSGSALIDQDGRRLWGFGVHSEVLLDDSAEWSTWSYGYQVLSTHQLSMPLEVPVGEPLRVLV